MRIYSKHACVYCEPALRDAIRGQLDRMTEQGVRAGHRIYSLDLLDGHSEEAKQSSDMYLPSDLNKSIRRAHYPLPTTKNISTRLANAKVVLVLDARAGSWKIKLDEQSNLLTTFNTPFCRYRWKRMPFGTSSVPEVWKQRMQEVVEGLSGVEVIADDFLVIGRGNTQAEATCDHEKNRKEFLKRAQERNLKLSLEKTKLRLTGVSYMGHKITSKGLSAHPDKVKAIREMPTPTDVKRSSKNPRYRQLPCKVSPIQLSEDRKFYVNYIIRTPNGVGWSSMREHGVISNSWCRVPKSLHSMIRTRN